MLAKLEIDIPMCQAHGRCYETAPDVLDADDNGVAVLKSDEPIDAERARAIAATCPEFAILVKEV
ncbi:ferredoxin [Thermomonospora echinospora]|uniref:Ferredoxin n=1 Tax=Thermomonospora echinospora TaxID=1992 RepID=A0A1H5TXC0_9ACTN|nr:ferredoxin [Thermomonospora echinospora]SEF67446.1 ferredoxin [Thermomonospora echinospora]